MSGGEEAKHDVFQSARPTAEAILIFTLPNSMLIFPASLKPAILAPLHGTGNQAVPVNIISESTISIVKNGHQKSF